MHRCIHVVSLVKKQYKPIIKYTYITCTTSLIYNIKLPYPHNSANPPNTAYIWQSILQHLHKKPFIMASLLMINLVINSIYAWMKHKWNTRETWLKHQYFTSTLSLGGGHDTHPQHTHTSLWLFIIWAATASSHKN